MLGQLEELYSVLQRVYEFANLTPVDFLLLTHKKTVEEIFPEFVLACNHLFVSNDIGSKCLSWRDFTELLGKNIPEEALFFFSLLKTQIIDPYNSIEISDVESQLWKYPIHQHIYVGMKPKKINEVCNFAKLVSNNCKDVDNFVEVGTGFGYLSSFLSIQLSMECDTYREFMALDRNEVLVMKAKKRHEKILKCAKYKSCEQGRRLLFESCSVLFPETSPFREAIQKMNWSNNRTGALFSLHGCGDLSPIMLRLFHNDSTRYTIVLQASCCYHLLTEAFESHDSSETCGFPMSQYLRGKKTYLGKHLRNSACSAFEYGIENFDRIANLHFHTALFHILYMNCYNTKKLVNLGTTSSLEFDTFEQLCMMLCDRLNIPRFTKVQISAVEETYSKYYNYLYLMLIFQQWIGLLIERFIILDRALYLKEHGYQVDIVQFCFNPLSSPRSCVLIGRR